jgi:uncharacterized protein
VNAQPAPAPDDHIDGHPIEVRRPRFEWEETPVHWVPGDPMAAHVGNALHLLFPAGERFFIDAVRDATPDVRAPELRAAIKPFIGQEAVHAKAHDAVLDHLHALGIDPSPYLRRLDRLFETALSDKEHWPAWARRWQLRRRLAVTAAIEHFTAVLGHWALTHDGLDEAGADPVMLDLFRWHAAEEVEHRALVFDVYQEVSGNYPLRAFTMIGVTVGLLAAWFAGVRFFLAVDPALQDGEKPGWREYRRAVRRERVPPVGYLLRSVPRYLRPGHHPSQECDTALGLAYLAESPAVRAGR